MYSPVQTLALSEMQKICSILESNQIKLNSVITTLGEKQNMFVVTMVRYDREILSSSLSFGTKDSTLFGQ